MPLKKITFFAASLMYFFLFLVVMPLKKITFFAASLMYYESNPTFEFQTELILFYSRAWLTG